MHLRGSDRGRGPRGTNVVTRLRACHSLTFASRVSSCRQNQTGLAKYSEQSGNEGLKNWPAKWENHLSHAQAGLTSVGVEHCQSLLFEGTSSTCSSARVCVIADSLYHSEFPQKCFNLHSEATTLMEQLFLWIHQKLHARTGTRDRNKASFLSFRRTLSAFAWAADVVWWRRADVNLKLIGRSCLFLKSAALNCYLKESSLGNKPYSIHLPIISGCLGSRRSLESIPAERAGNKLWTGPQSVTGRHRRLCKLNQPSVSQCLIQIFAPRFSFSGSMFVPTGQTIKES